MVKDLKHTFVARLAGVFVTGLFFAGICSAVGAQAGEPPCSGAEHRQFDFWLGHWEVKSADGRLLGSNHIHRILGACVLQENWKAAKGPSAGKSFNHYDRAAGVWRQAWVDNGGGHLLLEGALADASMVLAGDTVGRGGQTVRNRITWTPLKDGRVRQLWEASADAGVTWTISFDGYYAPVAPADQAEPARTSTLSPSKDM